MPAQTTVQQHTHRMVISKVQTSSDPVITKHFECWWNYGRNSTTC